MESFFGESMGLIRRCQSTSRYRMEHPSKQIVRLVNEILICFLKSESFDGISNAAITFRESFPPYLNCDKVCCDLTLAINFSSGKKKSLLF